MGVPGEEREKRADRVFGQKFLILMKDINININIQNAQRIPNKMTSKRYTPRHVIELLKDRIQRVARE